MIQPLINQDKTYVAGNFPDDYALIAMEIEQSLIDTGAIPGEDYTIVDLYTLAQPFMLRIWAKCQTFSSDTHPCAE